MTDFHSPAGGSYLFINPVVAAMAGDEPGLPHLTFLTWNQFAREKAIPGHYWGIPNPKRHDDQVGLHRIAAH